MLRKRPGGSRRCSWGNLSNRNGSDVFCSPTGVEPLPGKPRRIHPAAKREAHEYRTTPGNLVGPASGGASPAFGPGRGPGAAQTPGLPRPDKTRLIPLERARPSRDARCRRMPSPELACCNAALPAMRQSRSVYSPSG